MMYILDFWSVFKYLPALLKWLFVSLEITIIILVLWTIFWVVFSILKFSKNLFLNFFINFIINLFISLPVLVILFWVYYALPIFTWFTISAYITTIITLSLNLACFSSDIFVSSYNWIPKSEIQAWIVFNFSKFQILKEIVLPQIIKTVIWPISWRYVETIKLTSLASIISVNELLHVWQNIISLTYKPIEIYTMIAILYLIIIVPIILLLKYIEKKFTL